LEHQNRSLSLELLRNKRTIAETRKELEFLRTKHREMESLVSLIQRAWSQLDIDASLILDSLGDFEISQNPGELLHNMLTINNDFLQIDSQSIKVPQLDADEWSSAKEIEQEQERSEQSIVGGEPVSRPATTPRTPAAQQKNKRGKNAPATQNKDSNEGSADGQTPRDSQENAELSEEQLRTMFEHNLDQRLLDHVSFTLSLLEKLCNAINEGDQGILTHNTPLIQALTNARENASKIHCLTDAISKLRCEIVKLEGKHRLAENEKLRIERKLDKALLTIKELEAQQGANGSNATTGDENGVKSGNEDKISSNATNNEYLRQIALLENQLAESEAAKAQAEMSLTERLSRPFAQTEAQISDLRKAMEDLRFQCKQRVGLLVSEVSNYQIFDNSSLIFLNIFV
jgi:hypothetical protein